MGLRGYIHEGLIAFLAPLEVLTPQDMSDGTDGIARPHQRLDAAAATGPAALPALHSVLREAYRALFLELIDIGGGLREVEARERSSEVHTRRPSARTAGRGYRPA